MKILQLCKKFPFPSKDGESVAILSLARSLKEYGCEIVLLAMNTTKHFVDNVDAILELNCYSEIHTVEVDNRIQVKEAFLNLWSKDSYHISRFNSLAFDEKLKEILSVHEFDVVQMETLYLAPYLQTVKERTHAIISLRAHNIEHEIWKRVTENTGFIPKRLYLKYLTNKLKKYEVAQLNAFDIIVAISNRDLISFKSMGYKNGAIFTPVGIDSSQYLSIDAPGGNTAFKVGFIGSLDWIPNLNGINWFIENAWADLKSKVQNIELHIAGRNTPDSFYKLNDLQIKIHGEVPNAHSFINSCDTMIVPLFSGSGMRVKIVESMALSKTVVTTSVGLEGINAKHRKEIVLANTAEEFVNEIQLLNAHPDKLKEINNNARNFVKNHYDYIAIAKKLHQSYSHMLDQISKD